MEKSYFDGIALAATESIVKKYQMQLQNYLTLFENETINYFQKTELADTQKQSDWLMAIINAHNSSSCANRLQSMISRDKAVADVADIFYIIKVSV